MLVELVLGILLAAGGVYFVLRPILAPHAGDDVRAGDADESLDPEDDLSRRAVALRALKEIEFDRATGKLADADYDSLKQKYTTEALDALRADTPERGPEAARRPSARSASRPSAPSHTCPEHGPRPESEATFCSECGRRLAAATGYCSRCGTTLEPEARFCARCGGQVAA